MEHINIEKIKNKKILLFAPSFFNYEKVIVKKLEEFGASVSYFDERPSNTTFGKAIVRISKESAKVLIDRHYKNVVNQIGNQSFDFILLFQAEATPKWFLEYLNKQYKNVTKILYLWDSVSDKPQSLDNRDYYNEIFTFDPYDSKTYNLNFRPLFFADSYRKKYINKEKYQYDFSFIGTVRKDRYTIIEKLKKNAKINKQNFYVFYYLQSKIMYFYFKYIKKDFKQSNIKDFSFEQIPHERIQKILTESKILVDIQKPHQVGLTIRTIELLAAQKKFVTTNQEIKYYDFYNENNIAILSRENPQINQKFVSKKFSQINEDIIDRYSIGYFLFEILGYTKSSNYYINDELEK